MKRKELIEILVENDLECFYSNSYKKQEEILTSIFMELYGTTSEEVLQALVNNLED
jgi:hypothetical protein